MKLNPEPTSHRTKCFASAAATITAVSLVAAVAVQLANVSVIDDIDIAAAAVAATAAVFYCWWWVVSVFKKSSILPTVFIVASILFVVVVLAPIANSFPPCCWFWHLL